MNNKLLPSLFLVLVLASCQSKQSTKKQPNVIVSGDSIQIPEHSVIQSKIQLETIQLQNYSIAFDATGSVKPIPGQLAQVSVPFDGRITKSYVELGQQVKEKTPLFEMSSSDYYDATKHYYQAAQSKDLAHKNLQRQKDLVDHGVGARKDLEEAETNSKIADQEYNNAAAVLHVLNVNPANMDGKVEALKIKSPISGEIIANNIVLGQFVKSGDDPLVTIAELSKVWVVAKVKERHLKDLNLKDQVEIKTDASPNKTITGKIYNIGAILNEDTRSVEVIILCNNEDRRLIPGVFANIHFTAQPSPTILIPSTALLQAESQSYVFVQSSPHTYRKQIVKVASITEDGRAIISQGLQDGTVIIAKGGIYLMEH